MKRVLLLSLGCIALVLACIGLVLPILPTTPFVLCAAACFSASSSTLYQWLSKNRFFGEYIRSYKEKTVISRRTRVKAITFLWVTLVLSAMLLRDPVVWSVLGAAGTGVTIYLCLMRRK